MTEDVRYKMQEMEVQRRNIKVESWMELEKCKVDDGGGRKRESGKKKMGVFIPLGGGGGIPRSLASRISTYHDERPFDLNH